MPGEARLSLKELDELIADSGPDNEADEDEAS